MEVVEREVRRRARQVLERRDVRPVQEADKTKSFEGGESTGVEEQHNQRVVLLIKTPCQHDARAGSG